MSNTEKQELNIGEKFSRDANGLIAGVQYAYWPDGRINWRKMIKKEHLVVQDQKKKEFLEKYGKELQDLDVSEVEDKYLLILLSGIKELAQIRGFDYVQQHVDYVDESKAVVTCTIRFLGNFETGGQPVCFSEVASASVKNTTGIFQLYLESIAANRAFVRAVRNFLGINITGQDEIPPNLIKQEDALQQPTTATSFEPYALLADRAKKSGFSFDTIKKACISYKDKLSTDPVTWTDFKSINRSDAFFILGKLEEKK